MTLQPNDKRALTILGVAVVLALGYLLWPTSSASTIASADSVPVQEQRLARLRDIAATVPAKEEILKKVSADLAVREKGLIRADSIQQAQAQLVTILKRAADSQTPSIDIRGVENGPVDVMEDSYGSVNVSVNVDCSIDQLLKLMGSIAALPELIATHDLRVDSGNPKDKAIAVRLTVTGIVPKNLIPAKKGAPR
jgi:Tfp pilus assembly protein PilO